MSNLDDSISELAKQGIDVAAMDATRKDLKLEKFSTGLLSLDLILGGGYPKGRLIEIYGQESSGKSLMTLVAMAAVQKQGGTVCLVDAEMAFDPAWATTMGVDTTKLLLVQPDSGEAGLTAVDKLCASNAVQLIVVDSIAALVPQKEIDGEMIDQHMGLQARMMSQALRKLTHTAAKSKTTIIFINQIRNKIGVMYGNPETTPGGLAMKFYASIRFKVAKKDKINETEAKSSPVIGHNVKVDIIKTKVSQPYLSTTFNLMYAYGIDLAYDTLNSGIESGVIRQEGNNYFHGATKLALGRDAALEYLKTDPVTHDAIRDEVLGKIGGMSGSIIKSITAEAETSKKKKAK